MATRSLSERPNLEQLRKLARERQRESGSSLHEAQLALAREYGFASWPRLASHVRAIAEFTWSAAPDTDGDSAAAAVLRAACVTYHGASPDPQRARGLLDADPAAVRSSLAVAAVAGDVDAVRNALATGTDADEPAPPYGWTPLMYLAYSRLDGGADACLATASALLDAGADPNAGRYFDGYPTPFTVLTGVFGDGEHGEPPHPHARALARLLLDRGADPNDAQTLYNRQFDTDDGFLELLFEFGLGAGEGGPWRARLPDLSATPVDMVRGLLGWALLHDHRDRVGLLADRGVDLLAPMPVTSWLPDVWSPVEVAAMNGHRRLVELLRGHGCPAPALTPVDDWIGTALAGDAAAGPGELADRARAERPGLVVWAAAVGHGRSVELLVAAGFDVNALGRGDCPREQPWQTALHTAVAAGDRDLVTRLLALGADPSREDARYRSDARGWARFFDHPELLGLLEG